ncbi:MAG: hypothetical protein ACFFCY_14395 [Promethearchaeota archaeon]|jgi:hypothetical protein
MSEEFKKIVDTSFDNGTPLWIYTQDYIYGIVPTAGGKWLEVSYTFEDPDEPLMKGEKSPDFAYQLMMEEISKGVTFYIQDLKVPLLKEFAGGTGKSGSDLINAVITELVNNTSNYTSNSDFIIKSKDELAKLKEKV